ncbi:ABC transporter permease [uncultured Paracoccus sp.]|uniref:ABC transporter permease n=1 Tax=uncultured Paracoccus sp. TaxID=189685 RepID=UPI002601175D|nr:ABC transporter permease [uncultured Paracoccus sp.]
MTTTITTAPQAAGAPQRSVWTKLRRAARRKPLGAIGAGIILVFVVVAIFAPVLAPHDPFMIDPNNLLARPSLSNWMGTDEYGRDIASRIIHGARVSIFVGLMAVGIGSSSGALLGLVSGYFGGAVDYLIQRVMDTLMAFPTLILALAMVAVLGPSIQNVIIALAIVKVPNACRVVRATTLSVRQRPYIVAARNLGLGHARIVLVHILPNCLAPFIILATAGLGSAILSEASLSFLGLGTPPPEPSWGAMLSGKTQRYMLEAPWLAIAPGLAITLVVFGFNFLGDALRDLLDPHQREG